MSQQSFADNPYTANFCPMKRNHYVSKIAVQNVAGQNLIHFDPYGTCVALASSLLMQHLLMATNKCVT